MCVNDWSTGCATLQELQTDSEEATPRAAPSRRPGRTARILADTQEDSLGPSTVQVPKIQIVCKLLLLLHATVYIVFFCLAVGLPVSPYMPFGLVVIFSRPALAGPACAVQSTKVGRGR